MPGRRQACATAPVYVLQQGKVRLVLTTALHENNQIADHIAKHGDGVKDIALWVDDAASAYRETTTRGAKGVREPFETSDEHGVVKMSTIATYGERSTLSSSAGIIPARSCLDTLKSGTIQSRAPLA